MSPSLSVLLPVHNAQATLQRNVQCVLDVLPELTGRFEILIIDDGSTDATCEVAYELASAYPQIRVIRYADPIGWAAAVARQVSHTGGDFLLVHAGGMLEHDDVVGLWRLRQGIAAAALAKAKAAQGGKSWRVDPQAEFADRASDTATSGDGQPATSSGTWGVHARAQRSNLILVHRQQAPQLERSLSSMPTAPWPNTQPRSRSSGSGHVKRPSFLGRLKAFARGE